MIYIMLFRKRFAKRIDGGSRLISFFSSLWQICLYVFVYKAAFKGAPTLNGAPYADVVTYMVIVTALYNTPAFNSIKLSVLVNRGKMHYELLKPYSYPIKTLVEAAADLCVSLFLNLLPLLIFCGLTMQMRGPENLTYAILYLISAIFGVFVIWGIQMVLQMLGFWYSEVMHIVRCMSTVNYVLCGVIIPYWFMPKQLVRVLMCTPFAYIWFWPIQIYMGKVSIASAAMGMLAQLMWAFLLYLLAGKLYAMGVRSLQAAD